MYHQTSLFLLHFSVIFLFLFNHETASTAQLVKVVSFQTNHEKASRSSTPVVPPPSKPITLHINLTAVNITWTETADNSQYIIQMLSQEYNDTNFHNLTLMLNKTYYIYNGLGYGMFYQFRVVAYRDGQSSAPSVPSSIFDNGLTAPPGPPQNLQLPSISSDTVLLTWSQPVPANELKYLYHVYKGEKKDDLQLVDSIQENTQYTFKHLQTFTKYFFSVQADYGGERSILAPVVETTYQNPTLVPLATDISTTPNYTTVLISWTIPAVSKYSISIVNYTILYTPTILQSTNHVHFNFSKTVRSSKLSTMITNLEQAVSYAFVVQYAFVVEGSFKSYSSNVSDVQRTTTLSSLICLSCNSISSTQMSLQWQVLNTANHTQVYTITAVPSIPSVNFITWKSKEVFVIPGLHPWTTYKFTIVQNGTFGFQSTDCPLTDCRTNEDKPSGYPSTVQAIPINTTAVNISWSYVPRNQQNGIIEMYIIGCPSCPHAQYVTPNLYYVVGGLLSNTNYSFVVAAQNDKGFGPDSPSVTVKTIAEKLMDSPTDFLVSYTTHDYVVLSWQPPKRNGSEITLYTVTYTEADVRKNYSVDTTLTNIKLNLSTSILYIAWISAWTSVGQGPLSQPITFHSGLKSCPACFFNMTVDIMNPSRKCFAVDLSWRTYGVIDTFVTVVYYNVTLLSSSKSGVAAFNNRIDDPNITSFKISSDLLESRTEYIVILETHLLLDETQFSLQRNTSIKTPSCTGVTTVVAVVISSVCLVLAILSVGAGIAICHKWKCYKKNTIHRSHRSSSPAQMSRRFVIDNDYITLMKQQRGDGRSTNAGSLSTSGSVYVSPVPSLIDEEDTDSDSDNEEVPLLNASSREPPIFFSSQPLSSSFDRLEDVDRTDDDDGYIGNDLIPILLVKPNDSTDVPERPGPEGSSLSSSVSLESLKN